jgi:hypothetical protein
MQVDLGAKLGRIEGIGLLLHLTCLSLVSVCVCLDAYICIRVCVSLHVCLEFILARLTTGGATGDTLI